MTIQDYLESTTAVQLNRFTGCRIESTEGEEVLTINSAAHRPKASYGLRLKE